jgi:hypothetical protein
MTPFKKEATMLTDWNEHEVRDKWFDLLTVNAPDTAAADRVAAKFYLQGLEDRYKVAAFELEHGAFERAAFHDALEALNCFLAKIECPVVHISPDRMHVLTDREFDRLISPNSHACSLFGRIYLRRRDDPVKFLLELTHELGKKAWKSNV